MPSIGRHRGHRALFPSGLLVLLSALAACSHDSPAPEAMPDPNIKAAWVEIGENNQAIARVVTADSVCPSISVNGTATAMTLRAASATAALRTTVSDPVDSKPSAFPVTTCETALPSNTQQASVGGRALPLPKAQPQRIVVIADTGCRLKKADNAWQPCSDPQGWPFTTIAATAAGFKPDLVVHIGDYHYRENACPADIAGCQNSPWGYGWDTWEADLFKPAAPLMAAAPWVVVRGNHEECARAGQGWYRFLDTRGFDGPHSCDDPANDAVANFSDPYAVALGADSQLIVFDSAKSGGTALKTTDPKFATYQAQLNKVAQLASKPLVSSIWANHHPILAFAPISGGAPAPGSASLQSVMNATFPTAYYPNGIQIALHGHVHDFQALNFTSNHPATFVAGNGGDNVDVNLPDPLPAAATPASGAAIDKISHTNTYGFMVMDRDGARWLFKAYTRDGKLLTTCTQTGPKVSCDKPGFIGS